jgi:IS5 family transposase
VLGLGRDCAGLLMAKGGPVPVPVLDRFVDKILLDDECWEWTGGKTLGYGTFWVAKGTRVKAHRFAYEWLVGPVPEGLSLDHLCRNRGCVNPAHLEPVTHRENVLRGEGRSAVNARKTHCKNGHPYSGDNVLIVSRGDGSTFRKCRQCESERTR